MKKKLLMLVAVFIISSPISAQTATDLKAKYGKMFESFYIRPNILMTVEYSSDGKISEAVIEPRHTLEKNEDGLSAVVGDFEMSLETVTQIIDEIIPIRDRGKQKNIISFYAGCAISTSEIYEKVDIYLSFTCSQISKGQKVIQAVKLRWKRTKLTG